MEADIVIGADGKQPKLSVPKDINNIQVSTRGSDTHFFQTLRHMPSENVHSRYSCLHLRWMATLSRNNCMRTPVYSSGLAPGRHSIATAVPKRNEYDIQITDHEYGFEPDGSVGSWNERITDMHWLRDGFKDFDPAIVAILAKWLDNYDAIKDVCFPHHLSSSSLARNFHVKRRFLLDFSTEAWGPYWR